jgi:hypothetical protein
VPEDPGNYEFQRTSEFWLPTKMTVRGVPSSICKIAPQVAFETIGGSRANEAPGRTGHPCLYFQQSFGAPIICFVETIRAIQGNRHSDNIAVLAKEMRDRIQGRITLASVAMTSGA